MLPPSLAELVPFRFPRLLLPNNIAVLQRTASSADAAALEQLAAYSQQAYSGSLEWPIGVGPIEILSIQVSRGMISLDQAKLAAAEVGSQGDLIAPYVKAMGRFAVRQSLDGDLELSHHLTALMLAATRHAIPGTDLTPNGWTAWRWAADAHVHVATAILCDAPDDGLFTDAHALADEVVAWGRSTSPAQHSNALTLLGCLLLDPYTAKANPQRYWDFYELWQGRRPPKPVADPQPDEARMPDPLDALRQAAAALKAAIDIMGGAASALTWKALVQALHFLAILDSEGANYDVVGVARRALTHVDPDRRPFVELVLAEHTHGEALPGSGPPTPSEDLAEPGLAADQALPVSDLVARLGVRQAVTTQLWRLRQIPDAAPASRNEILDELWTLTSDHPSETLRREVLNAHLDELRAQLQGSLADTNRALAERAHELTRSPTVSPTLLAEQLLGLAADASVTDAEDLGLELVMRAIKLDPALPNRRGPVLAYLIALLRYGQACNFGSAGDLASAIKTYAVAAEAYIECSMAELALHCLQRVVRDASIDASTAIAATVALAKSALKLESALGAQATTLIAEALRTSSALLVQGVPGDVLVIRDQVAKGLRFAVAVAAPGPVNLDERARQMLREIGAVRNQSGIDRSAGVVESLLDDEDMLASFVAPSEATPGRTPAEVLVNLQRSFDEHMATVRYSATGEAPLQSLRDIQAQLDPQTLLISVYLGAAPDGRLTVHTQAITADSHDGVLIPLDFPSGLILMKHSGVQLTQSPLGLLVADLRRQIIEDPMFDDVDVEACHELATGLPRWFGTFAERLSGWRAAGLTHLIVWPQGPLHYLPWHLYTASADGRLICEDWTVTVLPTLGLLARRTVKPGQGIIAVGCADSGLPFGLPRVQSMTDQAAAITRAYGTTPIPENEATPLRLSAKLPTARFIHLATHGSHQTEAPAFQCVYLTPDNDGDGRLFAYQIASLDLSGVQLVTISACQSALGRFDLGDNLRGLPAAFLAAGASAVVGTLWPVRPPPATQFFSTLYGELARGASQLCAFHTAQLGTRQAYPEYRDWGAFCYVGDWRQA